MPKFCLFVLTYRDYKSIGIGVSIIHVDSCGGGGLAK